jgi:uncharacterized protein YyaL (SSP411 family)
MKDQMDQNQRMHARNRLSREASPYLLQHADQPVDWRPWGDEAFAEAGRLDKPVFLSIGYSTCHWCHVMAEESFADPEVARLLNETFVNIKVDREERPDVDGLYMSVCQALTGGGGWPLTILLTPERKPFYAGTYFPKATRFGRIGLLDLIPAIRKVWTERRDEVERTAAAVIQAIQEAAKPHPKSKESLDESALESASRQLQRSFDEEHGGFGGAPKFPLAHQLLFLLRRWWRTGDDRTLQMVEKTLTCMRRGGIFDHLGGGFHRYSTDERWLVPHFEKMLYDQALLSMVYIEAYQATRKEEYRETAGEIFAYVLERLSHPEGGFFTAEDADSEGEEGKYYLWKAAEVRSLLNAEEAEAFIRTYNIASEGNFHDPMRGTDSGENILHLAKSFEETAADLRIPPRELERLCGSARDKLREARQRRIPPQRDEKILTDWNGLMIAALAKGSVVLAQPEYLEAARRSAAFIQKRLTTPDGRLLHRYCRGEAAVTGNLDDYAFTIRGLLELYEATQEVIYLEDALRFHADLMLHFRDEEDGAFYFTADDGETPLFRRKEFYDGALPSGNSIALLNILKLARITADAELEARAEALLRAAADSVLSHPQGHTHFLQGVDFALGPATVVIVAGESGTPKTQEMLKAVHSVYRPDKVLVYRSTDAEPRIEKIAPYIGNYRSIDGKTTVYICEDYSCQAPITRAEEVMAALESIRSRGRIIPGVQ